MHIENKFQFTCANETGMQLEMFTKACVSQFIEARFTWNNR